MFFFVVTAAVELGGSHFSFIIFFLARDRDRAQSNKPQRYNKINNNNNNTEPHPYTHIYTPILVHHNTQRDVMTVGMRAIKISLCFGRPVD